MMPFILCNESIGVDKSDFVHFATSVRWHRKILMMTTRLNGDIDRAVWGVCDIQLEWAGSQFRICRR